MRISFKRLNHVQITLPPGAEQEARDFYGGLLGLEEIEKPEVLRANGGMRYSVAGIQLHVGVEAEGAPSKRHPGFEVDDAKGVRTYLEQNGVKTKDEPDIPGVVHRYSIFDPFGNRIELFEKTKG